MLWGAERDLTNSQASVVFCGDFRGWLDRIYRNRPSRFAYETAHVQEAMTADEPEVDFERNHFRGDFRKDNAALYNDE